SVAHEGGHTYDAMVKLVNSKLKDHFKPEFLNRVDNVVVFPQLTQDEIIQIVDLMIARLDERMRDKDMSIVLTDAAKRLLAEKGYDPVLGARPLRRAIQRDIEDHLSEKILFGDLVAGQIVKVDAIGSGDDGEFTFEGVSRDELDEPRGSKDKAKVKAAATAGTDDETASSS
ncbi:MAG TPA: NDP-hexose 4-ketoreductase, partial [Demequinaceae bacterium]